MFRHTTYTLLRQYWTEPVFCMFLLKQCTILVTARQTCEGNCGVPEMDQSPLCTAVYCLIIMRLIMKTYYNPPRARIYGCAHNSHTQTRAHQSEIPWRMIKISKCSVKMGGSDDYAAAFHSYSVCSEGDTNSSIEGLRFLSFWFHCLTKWFDN